MKTEILRLNAHDDVVSARDKMGWNQIDRILLVWPAHGQVLARPLDLVLLQRHSQSLGAQLALVTRDPEVRFHAHDLGIPVFGSLRRAQTARWRVPRHLPSVKPSSEDEAGAQVNTRSLPQRPEIQTLQFPRAVQVLLFSLGLGAFLLIAAALYPSAAITLHPRTQTQESILDLRAVPQLAALSDESVPLIPLQIVVEGRDQVAATGSILVPDRAAGGWVQFSNLTNEKVLIPAGTVVVSQSGKPVRFGVQSEAELAAGTDQSVTVLVRALEPGSQGNLASQTITGVEGPLGVQVAVNNITPTSGGSDRRVPAPTQDDRLQLYNQLSASLRESAGQELRLGLSEGDVLIPSSFELVETVEESYTPGDRQPGETLELSLRLVFQAQKISAEDLRLRAEKSLDEQLPAGYSALPGSLTLTPLADPVSEANGSLLVQVRASRLVQAATSQADAVRLVAGQTPDQAAKRLVLAMALQKEPEIKIKPGWWPRLPFLPFRISVTVQAEARQ